MIGPGKISKIFATFSTLLVVGMLFISSSVQGFSLNLDADDTSVKHGETILLTASMDIQSNENLPIDDFKIVLHGPQDIVCFFDTNGNLLSECAGITVQRLNSSVFGYGYDPNFGYNYGFSNGQLSFRVRINTAGYRTGTYSTEIVTRINNETFTKSGETIVVKSRSSGITYGGVCTAEWSCSSWSSCVDNSQTRTCYQNRDYCEHEEKPAEEQVCYSGNQQDLLPEKISLASESASTFEPEIKEQIVFNPYAKVNWNLIIILLLLNCIITTIDIMIKVVQDRRVLARRRFRRSQPVAAVN